MSALIDAIKKKDVRKIWGLLQSGVNVNEEDEKGETALFHAARWGRGDVVEWLLDAGADVNHKDKTGKTAIEYARNSDVADVLDVNGYLYGALMGHNYAKVKTAIQRGANVNATRSYVGDTFLHDSIVFPNLGVPYIQVFLEAGADPNKANNEGVTPLLLAVQKRSWAVAEALLKVPGIDVNKADKSGNTPLLFASMNPGLVGLLMDAGADPTIRGGAGFSPYMVAIMNTQYVSASTMIAKGVARGISKEAIVNIKDNAGHNAAFYVKDAEGVEQVAFNGVDLTAKGIDGTTPLLYSLKTSQDPSIAIKLVEKGADVNALTKQGESALLWAMYRPVYLQLAQVLLDKGININLQTPGGMTALMAAVKTNNIKGVQLLLERGADKTLKNNKGKTAFDLATDPDIKELLSDEPKPMWTGITSSDASTFDTFFEDKENWSCCPVCLSYVQRSEACRYMSHDCTKQAGVVPHKRLYDMYKNDAGIIAWCTICGRICRGHRHYFPTLQSSNELPPLAPIREGMTPFGGEQECIRDGGAGFPEKVSRFEGMLSKLKELQSEVGKTTERIARRTVVEAAWDAPFKLVTSQQMLQTGKFVTRPEEFPAPPAPAPAAPEVPAPDIPKPADELANVPEVIGEGGFDSILRYDTAPIIRFVHKKKDGTVYRHTDEELVSKEGLEGFIGNQNQNFGTDKFGYCFAPGCDAKLWPQDITDFLDDREIYEDYRQKFNRKFAAKVGGQGKNFLVQMTNAECALPEKKKGGKTYRRKDRIMRKKSRRQR